MKSLLQTLCAHVVSCFIVINLEYLALLNLPFIISFFGYAVFYAVTFYWISSSLKKWVFNSRVSPKNKAVLVTGCDRGFGYLLAKKLHLEGYKVFAACYFPNGEGAKILEQVGSGNIHIVGLDVTDSDSVSKALDYVYQHLEKSELWAVVNNAGIFNLLEVEFTDEENYRRMFEVNTLGVVRITRAFLPLLRKSRGRIVTVTSIAGRISTPYTSAYCMSKFATSAFCECLRQEIQSWGVKVVTVEPELYRTNMTSPDDVLKIVDESWEKAPKEVKLDYGEKHVKQLKSSLQFILKLANPVVSQVITCMFDAVSLAEPDYCYKPRYNLFHRFAIFCLQYQPRSITDFEIKTFLRLAGHPFPTTSRTTENTLFS